MARGGKGSTRQTGTKVSVKKLPVNTASKNHQTLNRAGQFTGKATSKIGKTS